MTKKRIISIMTAAAVVIAAMIIMAGCASEPQQAPAPEAVPAAAPAPEPQQETAVKPAEESAEEIVLRMSDDEKIGQVILMEFRQWKAAAEASGQGTEKNRDMDVSNDAAQTAPALENVAELNDEIREIIKDYHIGNIILFDGNCGDTKLTAKLTHDLQQTAKEAGDLPLLIGADQEGGSVTRLAAGTCLSGSMAIGLSGDTDNARLAGTVIGSELKAVGINCNFAPVADVNSNPENPVIGMRSFSGDAGTAAQMAAAMAEGLGSESIIACAKHFPGHGDTGTDSHTGLPLVEADRETWLERDAVPFRELISQGIPMIMTAHIQVPSLDDTKFISKADGKETYLPATLSKHMITDILKGEMGFGGVVVTDALNMDAISNNFGPYEAAIMALNAGADMLCMPVYVPSEKDAYKLEKLYSAIKEAIGNGELSKERLDDAAIRVVTMKMNAGILDADYDYDVNAAMENADRIVGGPENREKERLIADACIRLEYDGTFEAFGTDDGKKTVFFMPYDSEMYSVLHAISCMEKEGKKIDADVFSYQGMSGLNAEMLESLKNADYLVVASEQVASTIHNGDHWLNRVPQQILSLAETDRIAMICTGLPYQSEKFNASYPAFVLANYSGMNSEDVGREKFLHKYGPAIPAAVYRIFGD